MDAELKSLEDKIDQLVALYKDACSENIKLQQQLTDAIATNNQLSEKIHVAVSRLQTLLSNIPES
jgi:phage shock protein A